MAAAPTSDVDNNNQKIINLDDPTADGDATNKGYVDGNIGGQAVNTADLDALGPGNSDEVLAWDGSQWESRTLDDTTKLPLAGGTMTGNLNMGSQDITNANDITAGNDVSVGNNLTVSGGIGVTNGMNSGAAINLNNESELRLSENTGNGTDYVALKAPAALAGNVVWTLPGTDGLSGQMLQTNGSGVLSWSDPSSLGYIQDGGNATGSAIVVGTNDAQSLQFETNNTTAMTIDSSGNVGIGTTSPDAALVIEGLGQSTASMSTSTNLGASLILSDNNIAGASGSGGSLVFGGTGSGGNVGRYAAIKGLMTNSTGNSIGDLVFSTRNSTSDGTLTERVRINSSGNVGIGTSAPTSKLDVLGEIRTQANSGNTDLVLIDGTGTHQWSVFSATNGDFGFFNSGVTPFKIEAGAPSAAAIIASSGNVGIGTTSPSSRLHILSENTNLIRTETIANSVVSTSGLSIRRARRTVNLTTAALNGDRLGHVGAQGYGTTGYSSDSSAAVEFYSTEDQTDTERGAEIRFGTIPNGSTVRSERMRITNSGYVGIGTTAPSEKLEVVGTVKATAFEGDGSLLTGVVATNSSAGESTGNYIINTDSDGSTGDGGVLFQSNGGTVASISENGNLGAAAGSAGTVGVGFQNDSDTGIYSPALDTISLSAGGVEGLRVSNTPGGVNYVEIIPGAVGVSPLITADGADVNIDLTLAPKGTGNTIFSSGNVGIGTTSANSPIHIQRNGTSNPVFDAQSVAVFSSTQTTGSSSFVNIVGGGTGSTGQAGINFGDVDSSTAGQIVYRNADNSLALNTNGSESIRITSSGNVGIGTSNPTNTLNVVGSSRLEGVLRVHGGAPVSGNGAIAISDNGTGDDNFLSTIFGYNNGLALSSKNISSNEPHIFINSAGTVGIGTTTPVGTFNVSGSNYVAFDRFGASAAHLLVRSANGTQALPSQSLDGDTLGRISFLGHDGTNLVGGSAGAGVYATASEDWGGVARGSNLHFTSVDNGTTIADVRMTISESGYVGIGTTTPMVELDVDNGVINASALCDENNANCIDLSSGVTASSSSSSSNPTNYVINADDDGNGSGDILFQSNGSTLGSFTNGGNFVVGSNQLLVNPSADSVGISGATGTIGALNIDTDVSVKPDIHFDGSGSIASDNSIQIYIDGDNDSTSSMFRVSKDSYINASSVELFRIQEDGNVGIGTSIASNKLDVMGGDIAISKDTGNSTLFLTSSGTGSYPLIYGKSSNGDDLSAPTATVVDDVLARFLGEGHDGTAHAGRGDIKIRAAENFTGAAKGTYITMGTTEIGTAPINPVERLRITDRGRVGIGTTEPTHMLHVAGPGRFAGPLQLTEGNSATNDAKIVNGDNNDYLLLQSSDESFRVFLNDTERLSVLNSGNVGVGTSNPQAQFHLLKTDTTTSDYTQYQLDLNLNPSSNKTKALGLNAVATVDAANSNDISTIAANHGRVYHDGSGTLNNALAVGANSMNRGGGDITYATGFGASITNESTGSIDQAAGVSVSVSNVSSGIINDAIGLKVSSIGNSSGTINNTYGVYIGDVTGGGTLTNQPYSLYASDASSLNYFAGDLGIGTINPTSKLPVDDYSTNGGLIEIANFTRRAGDISDSDEGGFLAFHVSDGNNGGDAFEHARISWRNNGDGTNENEGELAFWTADNGTITERMTINNIGNVGIGTTSPSGKLDVTVSERTLAFDPANASTWADINVQNPTDTLNAASGIRFNIDSSGYSSNNNAGIAAVKSDGANYSTDLVFITDSNGSSGAERLRITESGNVGIGTSSPVSELDMDDGSIFFKKDTDYNGIYWGEKHTDSGAHAGEWTYIRQHATPGQLEIGSDEDIVFYESDGRYPQITMKMNTGRLGIGTTNPVTKLHVDGSGAGGGVCVTSDGTCSAVPTGGQISAETTLNTGADYAEYFEAEEKMPAGTIVGLNPTTGLIRRYKEGDHLIGIVSTRPGVIGNSELANNVNTVLVGLVGQVPFDEKQVFIEHGSVYTNDKKRIGYLLASGNVYINLSTSDSRSIARDQSQEVKSLKEKLQVLEEKLNSLLESQKSREK